MERKRPLGVTIVSVLMMVNGIILVGGGIWAAYFLPNLITPQLTGNLSNLYGWKPGFLLSLEPL